MALTDNDRIQELALLAGDRVSQIGKKWWYALAITVIAAIPAYYLIKAGFVALIVQNYTAPQIIYSSAVKEPLQVVDKQIFALPDNAYSGYVKIKNINLEWGVARLDYTVEFKTYGGTTVTQLSDSTFILPSSEKLIVFSRFHADKKPDEIVFTSDQVHFTHKPDIDFDYDLERVSMLNPTSGLVVSAGIKNNTAFTIKKIYLPVVVYDNKNKIVGASFTYLDDAVSGVTRTFQYSWPSSIPGATRAEITPEINIFDRNVFVVTPGVSPFDNLQQ